MLYLHTLLDKQTVTTLIFEAAVSCIQRDACGTGTGTTRSMVDNRQTAERIHSSNSTLTALNFATQCQPISLRPLLFGGI